MTDKIVETKRIGKWGNGLGVLLPKSVIQKLNLSAGDKIILAMENGVITLKKESDLLQIPRYNLEDLLKEYDDYQEDRDQTSKDWLDMKPVGREVL